jgi:hypothetical protein
VLRADSRRNQSYGIEVRLIRNGKTVEKRRVKVKYFDAMKIFKSLKALVECTAR